MNKAQLQMLRLALDAVQAVDGVQTKLRTLNMDTRLHRASGTGRKEEYQKHEYYSVHPAIGKMITTATTTMQTLQDDLGRLVAVIANTIDEVNTTKSGGAA